MKVIYEMSKKIKMIRFAIGIVVGISLYLIQEILF